MSRSCLPAACGWSDALSGYLRFLERHTGVLAHRVSAYLLHFIRNVAGHTPRAVDCTITCIDRWAVELFARGLRGDTVRHYVSAVRGFVRWLHYEGYVSRDLASLMALPLTWREAHMTAYFTCEEVRALLTSIPSSCADDLRGYALILLVDSQLQSSPMGGGPSHRRRGGFRRTIRLVSPRRITDRCYR